MTSSWCVFLLTFLQVHLLQQIDVRMCKCEDMWMIFTIAWICVCYKKGLIILRVLSTTSSWCMSSEYSMVQLFSKDDATIIASNNWNWYLSIRLAAESKVSGKTGVIGQPANNRDVWIRRSTLERFRSRRVVFRYSEITCDEICGFSVSRFLAISLLKALELSCR